jgi:L-ascorbate metabolism protein UlaG (beta-lactamase superfamily)
MARAPRFRTLDGTGPQRGLADVLRWKLGLGDGPRSPPAPARAPVPQVPNDGRALAGAERPALTWVGHATFLVQLAGVSVLTDPILSPRIFRIARNVPPGLAWEALPRIDAVVVSHNHYDHLDAPTLERLGSAPAYFVPRGLGRWFRRAGLTRVTEMDWWQRERVGPLSVHFVPSQHWSRRGLADTNRTLWGGFVLEDGARRVYHSGDTAYFEGFRQIAERLGAPTAALLPIGAYAPRWFMQPQHMDPADAVQAFVDLGAERFVAMHWGTFKLTDEPLDEPPRRLREAWAARALPPERLSVPAVGETLWL